MIRKTTTLAAAMLVAAAAADFPWRRLGNHDKKDKKKVKNVGPTKTSPACMTCS